MFTKNRVNQILTNVLIKECHLEKSCYFKDRANQGLVNQGLTV